MIAIASLLACAEKSNPTAGEPLPDRPPGDPSWNHAPIGTNTQIALYPQVAMRAGPGTKFKIKDFLPWPLSVKVLERSKHKDHLLGLEGHWVRIESYDGNTGWVYEPLLGESESGSDRLILIGGRVYNQWKAGEVRTELEKSGDEILSGILREGGTVHLDCTWGPHHRCEGKIEFSTGSSEARPMAAVKLGGMYGAHDSFGIEDRVPWQATPKFPVKLTLNRTSDINDYSCDLKPVEERSECYAPKKDRPTMRLNALWKDGGKIYGRFDWEHPTEQ